LFFFYTPFSLREWGEVFFFPLSSLSFVVASLSLNTPDCNRFEIHFLCPFERRWFVSLYLILFHYCLPQPAAPLWPNPYGARLPFGLCISRAVRIIFSLSMVPIAVYVGGHSPVPVSVFFPRDAAAMIGLSSFYPISSLAPLANFVHNSFFFFSFTTAGSRAVWQGGCCRSCSLNLFLLPTKVVGCGADLLSLISLVGLLLTPLPFRMSPLLLSAATRFRRVIFS